MAGTRRFTTGLAAARAYAERFEPNGAIERTRYLGALKKAAPRIGLPLRLFALVDMLFATSEDQDWQTPGVRPIVWPSNDWLCEQTGLSLTSLRRHLRALVDLGLIVPADSQNGRRWGRRAESGRIVAAFGFDLSPIAVRFFEFVELAADMQATRAARKELEREFTILRRTVQMILSAAAEHGLEGDWQTYSHGLSQLLERRQRREPLEDLINALRDLRLIAEEAFNLGSNSHNEKPKGAKNGTHILTTTQLDLCTSSEPFRSDANAPQLNGQGGFAAKGIRKKGAGGEAAEQAENPAGGSIGGEIEQISLGLVNAACPEIGKYAYSTDNWRGILDAAERVRPQMGVSSQAWWEARTVLGDNLAAVVLAVILEKQQAGEVRKPGGYLRGMIAKAHAGDLHVARTLYGLSDRVH